MYIREQFLASSSFFWPTLRSEVNSRAAPAALPHQSHATADRNRSSSSSPFIVLTVVFFFLFCWLIRLLSLFFHSPLHPLAFQLLLSPFPAVGWNVAYLFSSRHRRAKKKNRKKSSRQRRSKDLKKALTSASAATEGWNAPLKMEHGWFLCHFAKL